MTNNIGGINIKKLMAISANQKSPHDEVLKNAIISKGIEALAYNNDAANTLQNNFSVELETGKISNQDKSGRCWMFAGLNLFRKQTAEKLGLAEFEFSQVYPMFFDKLEKANYFLESIMRSAHEDIYSRIVMWLLNDPLQDGGQWEMFTNLLRKYGAVPKSVMPETYHSRNSSVMNQLLTAKLREWARELREKQAGGISEAELRNIKEEYLAEFYRLLVYFLGEPPTTFNFEYRDKDKAFHRLSQQSPLEFFTKYAGVNLDDYCSLIHAPTPDKPFNKTYTIDFLGNVSEGKAVHYLNLSLDTIKQLTIKQLKDAEPVWFGCDIRLQAEKKKGMLDTRIYLFNEALGTSFKLDKASRLLYGESLLTHAMVFTGVNLVDGIPNRWKVENSWGEDRGEKGFFMMSDSWFNEYTYQVVINRKYLSDDLYKLYQQNPVVLPPWDPMGSLALIN